MVLEIVGLVFLAVVILIIVAVSVTIYNGMIGLRKNIDKALANIDVLLKQRNDELPRLVESVKGYMKHERETFMKIVEARSLYERSTSLSEKAKSSDMMTSALKTVFALAENYPELKANDNFRHLQERISGIENEIADRREFYNDSVTTYNTRIEQVPYNFFANMLKYTSKEMFQATASEREVKKLGFDV